MSTEVTYHTDVTWTGGHRGNLVLGNGPEMIFSAPPDAHGESGVLTPEDAFVAAVNTCVMLMFLWACERFKVDLVSYECRGEGTKRIELDRTEQFTRVVLKPRIVVRGGDRKRIDLAMQAAVKYSLVASSIKSQLTVEPTVVMEGEGVAMLSIKILGPGCSNCDRLAQAAAGAATMLGVQASIEKVTDRAEIQRYRLLQTPGLVINEKLVCAGRVPDQGEIVSLLATAMSEAAG